MREYTLFSLFSGAGGLDLGFALNGFNTLLGNDKLDHSAETFSANFKVTVINRPPAGTDLPVFFRGDVAELKWDSFKDTKPDVLIGGPPCQDFSIVRGPDKERAGINVSRGRLYAHFVGALAHLQPKAFVFENVPGLISSNKRKAYEIILEDFSELNSRWNNIKLASNSLNVTPQGYEIIYGGLVDASKLGVPQARKRVIVLGLRKDFLALAPRRLPELKQKVADLFGGKNSLINNYPLVPIEIFEGRALPDLAERYAEIMREYEGVADEVGTSKALEWKRNVWDKLSFDIVDDYLALNRIKPASKEEVNEAFAEHTRLLKELGYYGTKISEFECPNGSNEIPTESKLALERMRRIPPSENHEFVRGTRWEVEGRGMSLIYRRIHPLKPSYTVVAYGGGGTWGYHYERSRSKLTNRERARLQTFPDKFVFKGSSSQVRAQIGEAVPPLMGKRIAVAVTTIFEVLGIDFS